MATYVLLVIGAVFLTIFLIFRTKEGGIFAAALKTITSLLFVGTAVAAIIGNYTLTGANAAVSAGYTITPPPITLSWQMLTASELVYDRTAKSVSAVGSGMRGPASALPSSRKPYSIG